MKLVERLRYYEKILIPVILLLSNGKELKGTIAKVEQDFLTFSTQPYGALDIRLDFIIAVGPQPPENEITQPQLSGLNPKKPGKRRRRRKKK
jgi:hypothetical protein